MKKTTWLPPSEQGRKFAKEFVKLGYVVIAADYGGQKPKKKRKKDPYPLQAIFISDDAGNLIDITDKTQQQ